MWQLSSLHQYCLHWHPDEDAPFQYIFIMSPSQLTSFKVIVTVITTIKNCTTAVIVNIYKNYTRALFLWKPWHIHSRLYFSEELRIFRYFPVVPSGTTLPYAIRKRKVTPKECVSTSSTDDLHTYFLCRSVIQFSLLLKNNNHTSTSPNGIRFVFVWGPPYRGGRDVGRGEVVFFCAKIGGGGATVWPHTPNPHYLKYFRMPPLTMIPDRGYIRNPSFFEAQYILYLEVIVICYSAYIRPWN